MPANAEGHRRAGRASNIVQGCFKLGPYPTAPPLPALEAAVHFLSTAETHQRTRSAGLPPEIIPVPTRNCNSSPDFSRAVLQPIKIHFVCGTTTIV